MDLGICLKKNMAVPGEAWPVLGLRPWNDVPRNLLIFCVCPPPTFYTHLLTDMAREHVNWPAIGEIRQGRKIYFSQYVVDICMGYVHTGISDGKINVWWHKKVYAVGSYFKYFIFIGFDQSSELTKINQPNLLVSILLLYFFQTHIVPIYCQTGGHFTF